MWAVKGTSLTLRLSRSKTPLSLATKMGRQSRVGITATQSDKESLSVRSASLSTMPPPLSLQPIRDMETTRQDIRIAILADFPDL